MIKVIGVGTTIAQHHTWRIACCGGRRVNSLGWMPVQDEGRIVMKVIRVGDCAALLCAPCVVPLIVLCVDACVLLFVRINIALFRN